jgi:2-polyprenyl-3-methyl-5-hydroxy-6-metoxy-1,4-benzoquinol methylase
LHERLGRADWSGCFIMVCIVCGAQQAPGLAHWHATCPSCAYESANLEGAINRSDAHAALNEAQREAGLKALRLENFADIIGYAKQYAPAGARKLLDVGSAHGWFLEAAQGSFDVLGIEPDETVGSRAAARGLPMRKGFFPDVLDEDERFDVIVFNDVIEHIPPIGPALQACAARLNPGGILILNLPNSNGFFYRLSKMFARCGWKSPFERLWQKGLPSPHVHYFRPGNLSRLVQANGFELVRTAELPSLRVKGLLDRLRCTGRMSTLALYAQYLAILAAIPLLRAFPSDIIVCIFRKKSSSA